MSTDTLVLIAKVFVVLVALRVGLAFLRSVREGYRTEEMRRLDSLGVAREHMRATRFD